MHIYNAHRGRKMYLLAFVFGTVEKHGKPQTASYVPIYLSNLWTAKRSSQKSSLCRGKMAAGHLADITVPGFFSG